ncbi:hypothetical protein [Paenibacillus soyae]|uniref:Uncharacterized protein n=1 Tax=Paenibacillus soyae TaxID=2969249 RepID=A0A9X2MXN8_9BACL|nr:hypothetical protein [Paenibacillus soyae]MCR2805332.1 hypothetical protein [Paenibacillus soyae]
MVKWELKQRYDEQGTKFKAVIGRYAELLTRAQAKVSGLQAEYEALMQREFQSGADMSVEKAITRSMIVEAQKEAEVAALEYTKVQDYAREAGAAERITIRDLVINWNGPYMTEVRTKELQPIVDRMRAARDAYYNAVLDMYELDERYHAAHYEVQQLEYQDRRPGDGISVHKVIQSMASLPQVNNEDLMDIGKYRKLPAGVDRTKNGGAA